MTNAEAQRMYRTFNRKWFGNRLPKDMVVHFQKMKDFHGVTSFFRDRPLYITLNWDLRKTHAHTAMTLLHEMVHVELPYIGGGGHGSKFHKRMMQLARRGAFKPWW